MNSRNWRLWTVLPALLAGMPVDGLALDADALALPTLGGAAPVAAGYPAQRARSSMECTEDADCMEPVFPFCEPSGCVQCLENSDCGSYQSCHEGICIGDCIPNYVLSLAAEVADCAAAGEEIVYTAMLGPVGPLACPLWGGLLTIELPNGSICEVGGSPEAQFPEIPLLMPGEVLVAHCTYVVDPADADGEDVLLAVARWEGGLVGLMPPLSPLLQVPYPVVLGSGGPCACPCDLNGDNSVDGSDLAQLLGAWGPNPGDAADVNRDDLVGADDLALMLADWGACGTPPLP